MRTRAYRPEVPGCLEGRSLLSGVAGLSADPVVLSHRRFNTVAEQIRLGFQSFGRDRDVSHLGDAISDVAVMIPFGRVDGLGVSINRILNRMQDDLSANVPHAVRSARNDAIAVTRADVEARVQAGDVVVR
jgi:hypothetical protein